MVNVNTGAEKVIGGREIDVPAGYNFHTQDKYAYAVVSRADHVSSALTF